MVRKRQGRGKERTRLYIPGKDQDSPLLDAIVPVGSLFHLWQGPAGHTLEECNENELWIPLCTAETPPLVDTTVHVPGNAPVQFVLTSGERVLLTFLGTVTRRHH